MNIPIIYEDDWLLVADKPAGLLSVPAPGRESRTLTGILNRYAAENGTGCRLYPCHRLDRETCGLIIYAKGRDIERKMADMFRARKVHKKYIAFVHGSLKHHNGEIDSLVGGKRACTRYKVIREKSSYSVVEAYPLTGRTNQIRLHFKNIGHPLVGEDRFIFRRDFALRSKRLCLQAKALCFRHPVTGKNMEFDISLERWLEDFLFKHD
ncbi:MAG: RluA family pseudouridine synthase [Candidatus Omnitrophica bacterium]|nr:RluA family pseudouridine synthase [Candidatus Omnitrophota bacterium]MDD5042259.1 RluA family pseudouridine synthase [Candidatus Omnitrophota bacterium]MDD5500114.1 RluA family pseudouridine synthase [Candidatus Omnitrophota bacterium]